MSRVGAVTRMLILGEVQILASALLLWPMIRTASSLLVPVLFLVPVVAWATGGCTRQGPRAGSS